jgi:hypothetical protein
MADAASADVPNARALTRAEMARRPGDPWPRGQGHVILAVPGSSEDAKGYHEPGGGFSPGFATFGVSFWLTHRNGSLVTTSDGTPLETLTQRIVIEPGDRSERPDMPRIETTTPWYTAAWSSPRPGVCSLRLHARPEKHRFWIVFRGVGPAGGGLFAADWREGRLIFNHGWEVEILGASGVPVLGSETAEDWMRAEPGDDHWRDPDGWAYARVEVPAGEHLLLLRKLESGVEARSTWSRQGWRRWPGIRRSRHSGSVSGPSTASADGVGEQRDATAIPTTIPQLAADGAHRRGAGPSAMPTARVNVCQPFAVHFSGLAARPMHPAWHSGPSADGGDPG